MFTKHFYIIMIIFKNIPWQSCVFYHFFFYIIKLEWEEPCFLEQLDNLFHYRVFLKEKCIFFWKYYASPPPCQETGCDWLSESGQPIAIDCTYLSPAVDHKSQGKQAFFLEHPVPNKPWLSFEKNSCVHLWYSLDIC